MKWLQAPTKIHIEKNVKTCVFYTIQRIVSQMAKV